jgi:hypothetical protein
LEKNRRFSRSSYFPLIGLKLGDGLSEVAHLLPCDHVVKIWWQLVLIWPQIEWILVGGDLLAICSVMFRDSRTVQVLPVDSPPLGF